MKSFIQPPHNSFMNDFTAENSAGEEPNSRSENSDPSLRLKP